VGRRSKRLLLEMAHFGIIEELPIRWNGIGVRCVLTVSRDRADYDPSLRAHVAYSVPSVQDAPKILKYGPSFMELAAKYPGRVVLGKLLFIGKPIHQCHLLNPKKA
jgi:hypothetical protein